MGFRIAVEGMKVVSAGFERKKMWAGERALSGKDGVNQ
jgi:hypothetical protein